MHAYIHTYIHTYIHSYIHTYTHTYTQTQTQTHTHTHTHIHTHTHRYDAPSVYPHEPPDVLVKGEGLPASFQKVLSSDFTWSVFLTCS
jgi:carbohydrate-binding DOMON domain-containing protein